MIQKDTGYLRYVRGNARFYFENNAALLKYFLSLSKPSETNIENKKESLSQGNSQLLSQNNFTLSKSFKSILWFAEQRS